MDRVLITGASGFLGGALARRLGDGGRVEVLTPGRAVLDLRSAGAREALDALGRVDVVVHAAASRHRADPSPSRFPHELAMNVQAAAVLYDWARTRGARAIVHVSTLSVLAPSPDPTALLDDDGPQVVPPAHPYALTKRWAEELVLSLRGSFEAAAIVRPGMAYGPRMSPGSGMGRLLAAVRSGAPYVLDGEMGHRYAPVHVDDVVDVLARLVAAPRSVTVTVGGPTPLHERQIVQDLATHAGIALQLEHREGRSLSNAPSNRVVDALYADRSRTAWEIGVGDVTHGDGRR